MDVPSDNKTKIPADISAGEQTSESPDNAGPESTPKWMTTLRRNAFLILLLFGIICGIVSGIIIRTIIPDFGEDQRKRMYLAFPGEILMRMLTCCIVPLIVTTIVTGMASMPLAAAGSLGRGTVITYFITMFLAASVGLIMAISIRPGEGAHRESSYLPENTMVHPADALLDLIRNALPDNIIEACFLQTKTNYSQPEMNDTSQNLTAGLFWVNKTENETTDTETKLSVSRRYPSVTTRPGINVLGLVVISVVLGCTIGLMGEAGQPVKQLMCALQDAVLRIVNTIIWYCPVGIAFIIAERLASMKDPSAEFHALLWYMLAVLLGLFIHGFILLPLLYLVVTSRNPFKFMARVSEALFTALGTASSSATLPVTLHSTENIAEIDARVTRFVIPVGATVNMDGTALYEAVVAIFIAQLHGYPLSLADYYVICLCSIVAAVGAAGIPEAGLVTVVMVLTAVGLPTDYIGLIFVVDWFFDRFRTMVNVWGDCVVAGIMERWCASQLKIDYAAKYGQGPAPGSSGYDELSESAESTD